MDCVKCIRDKNTGVCYEIKDEKARQELETLNEQVKLCEQANNNNALAIEENKQGIENAFERITTLDEQVKLCERANNKNALAIEENTQGIENAFERITTLENNQGSSSGASEKYLHEIVLEGAGTGGEETKRIKLCRELTTSERVTFNYLEENLHCLRGLAYDEGRELIMIYDVWYNAATRTIHCQYYDSEMPLSFYVDTMTNVYEGGEPIKITW